MNTSVLLWFQCVIFPFFPSNLTSCCLHGFTAGHVTLVSCDGGRHGGRPPAGGGVHLSVEAAEREAEASMKPHVFRKGLFYFRSFLRLLNSSTNSSL